MNVWHDIESNRIKPEDFIAVIEISKGFKQKYEMDKKTGLLGLPSYARGGDPVYEFSRFYRKLMEDKLLQKKVRQDDFRKIAMKALSEQVIQEQLALGHSAGELLNRIMNDEFLLEDPKVDPLLLPKK